MKRKKLLPTCMLCVFIALTCNAQIVPENHSKLNHTEIMFEHPPVQGAVQYRIRIAEQVSGKFNIDPAVVMQLDSTPATLVQNNLQFGKKYMWRYEALDKNRKPLFVSPAYYFETLSSLIVHPSYYRITITKECSDQCHSGIVFMDGFAFAVNRKGDPKWFVPGLSEVGKESVYRDIHLTPAGTVMYLGNSGALETDLSGKVIWKAPLNKPATIDSKEERYHHAFTKDEQSNYMVCGKKNMIDPNAPVNGHVLFEYDSTGKEILRIDMLEAVKEKTGLYPSEDTTKIGTLGHMNGFVSDPSKEQIYVSFRDFNSIFRIDKKSGRILSFWGNKNISYEKKQNDFDHHLFAAQHAPVLLKNGNLLVFNNNIPDLSSSVVEVKDDGSDNGVKVWEYVFSEQKSEGRDFNPHSEKMGALQELSNGNILVGMGSVGRVLEITKDKQLVWEMFPERRIDSLYPWSEGATYRVFYASSLYPSYFTIEHRNASNRVKMNGNIVLKINNEGTEKDRYAVELFYGNNTEPALQDMIELNRESSAMLTMDIAPGQVPVKPVKVLVRVTPSSNKKASRVLVFELVP